MNFQMFKLVLEKAEEPEIKLPTSGGSSRNQESSRKKKSTYSYWLCWRNINKHTDIQIYIWYHPYGRKWRGTKKPLDESESGEWTCWLTAQHSENGDHGIWSHHFMGNRWGNSGNRVKTLFWGAPKSLQMVTAAMKLKDAYSLEEKLWPT